MLGFPRGERAATGYPRETATKGPKGNSGFLVPETFSSADPARTSRRSNPDSRSGVSTRPQWSSCWRKSAPPNGAIWPKPVGVSIQDGEWLFRFRNHENDRNPSTIALGHYRRLQLNGQHGFEQRQFYLPDQMTAQDLGNHLAERLGWQPLDEDPQSRRRPDPRDERRIKQAPGFQIDRFTARTCRPSRSRVSGPSCSPWGPIAMSSGGRCPESDLGMVSLVLSVEGHRQTTAGLPILANEALEDALGPQ